MTRIPHPLAPILAALAAACASTSIAQTLPTSVSTPSHGLRAAPGWVTERLAHTAPDLSFEFNSAVLRGRERRKLSQIAAALQDILHEDPDLIIIIEGYSDDRDVREYNDRLALERAETVQRALLNLSLPEDRLRTASFCYRAPQCPALDNQCRGKNRRVHFRVALALPDTRFGA